jgi:PIN domain nuclease of toxin-antitoxin system
MKTYVADTHALIFYLSEPARLGSRARKAFAEAVRGEAEIVLPVIIFAELIFAVERGRVKLDVASVVRQVKDTSFFQVAPLTLEHLLAIRTMTAIVELHDRIIAAEALARQGTLITRDANVRKSGIVPTVW